MSYDTNIGLWVLTVGCVIVFALGFIGGKQR